MENGKKLNSFVRKTIFEEVKKLQEGSKLHLDAKDVPFGIRRWANGIKSFSVDQSGEKVYIGLPWHEADRVDYQFFKLDPSTNDATEVGHGLYRSGFETDSPQGYKEGEKKTGYVEVPEGFVLAAKHSYPRSVKIYTGPGAQMILQPAEVEEISDNALIALVCAKALQSFARPKFDLSVYQELIQAGLMASNKSITTKGRNYIQNPSVKDRYNQLQNNSDKYLPSLR